jgi:hypothetical protein
MGWLILVGVVLVLVAVSASRKKYAPVEESNPLVTVLNPAITMPSEFQFEPSMGVRNNPPMLFRDYAFVSRYVGGTKDYSISDGVFTSSIDTTKFPLEYVKGGGPQRILQIANELPLRGNVYEFAVAVPEFEGDGVAQVTFVLYASDGSGKTLAVVLSAWDSRYDNHDTSTMYDYQVPFASTPLRNTRYCTLLPGSATMFTGISTELRTFRFTITDQQWQNIIEDANEWQVQNDRPKFFTNLDNWQIGLTGILQEVFLFDSPYKKVKNTVRFCGITIESHQE